MAVLIPQTLFAAFSSLSGRFTSEGDTPSLVALLGRLPHVAIWIWLQLLVLDLANQRLPDSIAEDTLNKPWRPIPAKRITVEGSQQLLVASVVVALMASTQLGGTAETLLLFAGNWTYNDVGFANGHWIVRNLWNAIGITTIGAGATRVACGLSAELSIAASVRWWALCGGMLMTTIHIQDLYDQEGDAARGRRTAPLVIGDGAARWSLVVAVLFWSVGGPSVMGLSLLQNGIAYIVPLALGGLLIFRVLSQRTVLADKKTFKLWALWTVSLYAIPLATTS